MKCKNCGHEIVNVSMTINKIEHFAHFKMPDVSLYCEKKSCNCNNPEPEIKGNIYVLI
jgi:hypothetical protein